MTGIIINGILVLFGTTMIYMLLWRVLFFDSNREADPIAVDAFVAQYKRGGNLEAKGRLGTLKQLFDEAQDNPVLLRKSLERFRRLIERFHDAISVVANAAMGIGFLGTVVSMAGASGGKVDPVTIIGLGMMSTMYGLIIALPGTMFHGLTNGRVMRFQDQVDAILEALDYRINPPASVPSPTNGSPTNGRLHKRTAELESDNGRHPRESGEHAKAEVGRFQTAPAKSVEQGKLEQNASEVSAIETQLAADPCFGERVLDWVSDSGETKNETTT